MSTTEKLSSQLNKQKSISQTKSDGSLVQHVQKNPVGSSIPRGYPTEKFKNSTNQIYNTVKHEQGILHFLKEHPKTHLIPPTTITTGTKSKLHGFSASLVQSPRKTHLGYPYPRLQPNLPFLQTCLHTRPNNTPKHIQFDTTLNLWQSSWLIYWEQPDIK